MLRFEEDNGVDWRFYPAPPQKKKKKKEKNRSDLDIECILISKKCSI